MKRFLSTQSKNIINITSKAWDKMKYIHSKKNSQYFIFSANSGGCNGFNYKLDFIKEINEIDQYLNNKIPTNIIENDNIKVIIDPMTEFLVFGTTIDYISEDFDNGIFENKFIFIPDKNLNSSCGCGISFTPKKNESK